MAEPMVEAKQSGLADPSKERQDWLLLLGELVGEVEGWIQPEWTTRVIEKTMRDELLGEYTAPTLMMQREVVRVLLEPIARFTPGTEGVLDFYLMPAYDDVAHLYRIAGEWKLLYAFPGDSQSGGIRSAEGLPLTQENFSRVLDSIAHHGK